MLSGGVRSFGTRGLTRPMGPRNEFERLGERRNLETRPNTPPSERPSRKKPTSQEEPKRYGPGQLWRCAAAERCRQGEGEGEAQEVRGAAAARARSLGRTKLGGRAEKAFHSHVYLRSLWKRAHNADCTRSRLPRRGKKISSARAGCTRVADGDGATARRPRKREEFVHESFVGAALRNICGREICGRIISLAFHDECRVCARPLLSKRVPKTE